MPTESYNNVSLVLIGEDKSDFIQVTFAFDDDDKADSIEITYDIRRGWY